MVGRAGTWRELLAAVTGSGPGRRATLLVGEAGIGKSTLLEAVGEHGRRQGWRVLRTAGARSGRLSTFTNLRELLAGLALPDLPQQQLEALRRVLDPSLDALGAPAAVRLAVRSVLEAAAEEAPLLLLVDDVDRVDESSYDVLLPVLSRLPEGRVGVLVACREELVPRELGPVTDQVRVQPLDGSSAAALLDASGHRVGGRVRQAVLRAAAGNPLALVELARSAASGALPEEVALTGALPVPRALAAVFARDLEGLPAPTRWALLLAACGEGDLDVLRRAAPQLPLSAWEPAERRGLVGLDGGRVLFRHPLVESHAYFAAPAAERARAHRALAVALAARADRAALHLAAATCTRCPASASSGASAVAAAVASLGLPAFQLGDPAVQRAVARELPRALERCGPALAEAPSFLFTAAVCAPDAQVRERVLAVATAQRATGRSGGAAQLGAAASVLDEPVLAADLLREPVDAVVGGRAPAVYLSAPGALVWVLLDLGRWRQASAVTVANLEATTVNDVPGLRAGACGQLAVLELLRGHRERAAAATERLRAEVPLPPVLQLRLTWARALAAAAEGRHEEVAELLEAALAAPAGVPQPHGLLVLPELVAAARRTGRLERARRLVAAAQAPRADGWLTARQRLRVRAADALLLAGPAAAAALQPVVDDPLADTWPLEQAVLQVELAELHLGERRTGEAREAAAAALDTFERLGAEGWQRRARQLLRATGVQVRPAAADALSALTPQQEQVVRLAAEGLSNRDIGERLYLSPRTVGSHLYRSFPKLGVGNRAQLAALLTGSAGGHRAGGAGAR
nr:LuxR family transcriptional regulator [Kineococcus vitellinus]